MKFEKKQHGETAKSYAYNVLKNNIISIDLEPGCTLNDNEISQLLGISRTPVREAIIQLKDESDIIEIFPQRGMRVALIDTDIVAEARYLRLIIEKAIIEEACDKIQDEDFKWYDENIKLQKFYLKNSDFQKLLKLDNEFHKKLFKIAKKEMIYQVSRGLSIHYDRVRNLEANTSHGFKTVEDHKKIVEALYKRDKKLATSVIEEHLGRWLINEQMLKAKYPQYFSHK